MHDLLKLARRQHLGLVVAGCAMSLFASCGFPGRGHHGHSPFDFAAYGWMDGIGACAGLLVLGIGLFRLWRDQQLLRAAEATMDAGFMLRAGTPRSIYELLLGVAAVDGRIDVEERAAVARLMTRELGEGVLAQDLKNWSTTVEPPRDPALLAQRLTRLLAGHERRQLVQWCQQIVAVDGGVDGPEHDVLRRVTAALNGEPLSLP